jgi:hypothetical protein
VKAVLSNIEQKHNLDFSLFNKYNQFSKPIENIAQNGKINSAIKNGRATIQQPGSLSSVL